VDFSKPEGRIVHLGDTSKVGPDHDIHKDNKFEEAEENI